MHVVCMYGWVEESRGSMFVVFYYRKEGSTVNLMTGVRAVHSFDSFSVVTPPLAQALVLLFSHYQVENSTITLYPLLPSPV